MPRFAALALVMALQAAPSAQLGQTHPIQADPVVRLLADLEAALESGRPQDLQPLLAAGLPAASTQPIRRALAQGPVTRAVVRERARRPVGSGYEVLAEVLVSRGRNGRVATWQIGTRPRQGSTDRYEITSLTELAAVDGLLRLALDTTRQFTVHNLTFHAPDLVVKMASGAAFVAESDSGPTAIVLHGKGELHFTPPDPAEQGQLKIFAGHPTFDTSVEDVFIRVSPGEFTSRLSEHSLVASPRVDVNEVSHAQALFDEFAPKTYNLDLGDLSDDRWSIEPGTGAIVVEFKSRHHGWLTYTRSPSDAEDVAVFDRTNHHNLSVYPSAEKLAERGRFYSEDDGVAYQVEHYALDVTFNPDQSWVSGRASMRVRIRSDGAATLTLHLASTLEVSSVSSPDFGRLLALRVSGQNSLIVSLPERLAGGTTVTLDIVYAGRLAPQPLDREAIAVEGQAQVGQSPVDTGPTVVLEPEPRFLYSNTVFWYPQPPVTEYATATMRLTVPSEYQIIASGTLTGSSVRQIPAPEGGREDMQSVRTVSYEADRPARYLTCLISRFVPISRLRVDVPAVGAAAGHAAPDAAGGATAGVDLEIVATPRETSKARQLPSHVADMLRFFARMLGDAPYPNFTLAVLDDNLPGGHSPPYFAAWLQPLPTTPYVWGSDPVALRGYPDLFLAHEVAHQWWGEAIGGKNYHEQWLSEGFAQYFAALYAGSDRGPDELNDLISQMRESAERYDSEGPIYLGYRLGHIQNESRVFRAIVYNKSAVVLHMLRRLIGDDAFFGGLRRFYQTWQYRKAGTNDLRDAFQAVTPIRLERFFDRWVMGSTLPRLRVTAKVDAAAGAVVVRVEQIGETFDLPLTVTVQFDGGPSQQVTIPVTAAVVEQRVPLNNRRFRRVVVKDDLTMANIVK
jgi:Peptidase family M1 domain